MNHETTDFARFRFTPRTSSGPHNAVAVERYARPIPTTQRVLSVLLAVGLGLAGALLLVHWWSH